MFIRWSNSPEGMAKHVSKVMRMSLMAFIQSRNPSLDTEDDKLSVYMEILRMRPGYTPDVIEEVVMLARGFMRIAKKERLSFNHIVYAVVVREYKIAHQANPTDNQVKAIMRTVDSSFAK